MAIVHPSSVFNVRATINQWFQTTVNTFTLPSWASAFTYVFTMPEQGISVPCYSLFHIDVSQTREYQGNHASETEYGQVATALLEVSAWVSRSDPNWLAQLGLMESLARAAVGTSQGIVIQNYLTVPGTPTATTFKIDLGEFETLETSPDPNPDIVRKRMLMRYNWVYRQYKS